MTYDLSHNSTVMNPEVEYQDRLQARKTTLERRVAQDGLFSYLRLSTFAAGAVAAILAGRGSLTWWWVVAFVGLFLWLVRRHDTVIQARVQAERAVAFYERGLARVRDTWMGEGGTGDRFMDADHPYAADLDLFGDGSLFQLLSIARTQAGEEELAAWLKAPAPPDIVRERQAAIIELAGLSDLREAVAIAGIDTAVGVHSDPLLRWAENPPQLTTPWLRPVAIIVTAATVASVAVWVQGGSGAPIGIALLLGLTIFAAHRPRMHRVMHASSVWSRDLDVFAHVLEQLERESFTSTALERLRRHLETDGVPPSAVIRRLRRLVEMHDWQHNLVFAIVAVPLLWDVHIAFAMESWRRRFGHRVRTWLTSVGEFEALSSLATYRFEHPDDAIPAILEPAESPGAVFAGVALGHPLLPASRMVRNDVALHHDARLLIVSGSNMSGKSTLLRTVGVNAVLAFAGAPARATSLTLTPLALGATLRIQDSLQQGRSRFYAEITRIRELADIARSRPPLLFLLDELFHGTNSHDRLVGAAGVLRSLLDRGAVGLITTHDLALTAIAAELPGAVNVHFEDRFEAGEIVFDHRMKAGPVTRSNAVALMRAVGLEVPEEGSG